MIKINYFLFLLLLILTHIQAEQINGNCGDDITWNYDTESHEMMISGNGEMRNTIDLWDNIRIDVISPENVIEYIGRYSFRIAISNERIKSIDNGMITFEYKDYKDNGKIKLMTITAEEFIRRFLMHVLPNKFTKIKHYGILTNRNKKSLIKLCRMLIKQAIYSDFTSAITRKRKLPEFECSECGHKKFIYAFYYRSRCAI